MAESINERVLPLEGPLTIATVSDRFRELAPVWSGGRGPAAIDLALTSRVDSAGLALLLEWQALARQRGASLAFHNPSSGLLRLAALCEATDALGLAAPEGGQETAAEAS
jgi:ABC-type transporter Mla MlaB component